MQTNQEASLSQPALDEPCARGTIFIGFRKSATDLWGPKVLTQLRAKMPEDTAKAALDGVVVSTDMLPERHVMAWYSAAMEGPCGNDPAEFARFLDRMMDHGFGRVRKALLALATPALLARKCADLWRHDHTHGTLTADVHDNHLFFTLTDHTYLQSSLSRTAIAEIYRYACSLARAKNVTAASAMTPDRALRVRIEWK